ncbi:acyl-CoA dehydratase activase [Gracilinema caldarium]|uniref:CoA-substrate-specific enzyme activase n=1 Tax=Gracilinema caldarium (strain ATCC 51460 / DSM 7334 / H1) TaxID=744872 RepID=F8F4C5_GRAC1|nr:acyl-CoA dehydratase activase [Gracilinema caldarium]AEJ20572.1 CoA-substrate-specific enzyme activase [Gracilinema caldarium DSM 7334]
MNTKYPFLGIDCGSTTVKIVVLDADLQILDLLYAYHKGNPYGVIQQYLQNCPYQTFSLVSATSSTPYFVLADHRFENKICFIDGVKRRYPDVKNILLVGSEKFARIIFNDDGSYRKMKANSTCAAGTGSFLDQQAVRLAIESAGRLAELAAQSGPQTPRIASRCSVFAKTDLIHAQQEGWALSEISDGLCAGLARNIADTLFPAEQLASPTVMVGGVALNRRVVQHLSALAGAEIMVDESAALYGAIGAVQRALQVAGNEDTPRPPRSAAEILGKQEERRRYVHQPLEKNNANYPDFSSYKSYNQVTTRLGERNPVEIDLYVPLSQGTVPVYLGIDIGSTSTKAALLDENRNMLAGLYTRTAGDPIRAVQGLLEAMEAIEAQEGVNLDVRACATTGSGRKLIGAIIGADGVIDEITAHARAAVELDPQVDTIIEIGGQDSKFTVLKDGVVVFSQMNTVCAAGTGSFIEEQAVKLGVPIRDYALRALGHPAPATSDRCTVFMERDLNNYQNEGYAVEELLVATLFSVADNYLSKVAMEGSIGSHVVFQGATAKNKALVAAFEERLKRSIAVSPYCHLTGAMGAVLQTLDDQAAQAKTVGAAATLSAVPASSASAASAAAVTVPAADSASVATTVTATGAADAAGTKFRGLGLSRETIAQRNDVCNGCTNNCKLHIITVQGEEIVYGYLCGRGAGDRTFVSKNKSGFDLLRERRHLLEQAVQSVSRHNQGQNGQGKQSLTGRLSNAVVNFSTSTIDLFNDALHQAADSVLKIRVPAEKDTAQNSSQATGQSALSSIRIGIPRALYMQEDSRLWQYFFQSLGFTVVMGEDTSASIGTGKRIAGADFCAPISMIHGQVQGLLEKADYVFLPIYLEAPRHGETVPEAEERRFFYCNYSQYTPTLVSVATDQGNRILKPLIYSSFGNDSEAIFELREMLRPILAGRGIDVPVPSVLERLYRQIKAIKAAYNKALVDLYQRVRPETDEFAIILTGRPYTALSRGLNKGIPDMFAQHGLKVFFHDMFPSPEIHHHDALLQAYHWYYASRVIETALYCRTKSTMYPVLVTSFKCGPDSFAIETFKEILDKARKPYLILQIDEHDSAVGYETRIEAAVRAFRNHFHSVQSTSLHTGPAVIQPAPIPGGQTSSKPKAEKIPFPRNKTVLLPNWDPLVVELLAAALRGHGIDAHVLEEKSEYIQHAMTHNSGQCIPVSVIAYEVMKYIETRKLDPQNTVLWMVKALWPCNIPLYPLQIESILRKAGKGMEAVQVFTGDLTFMDVSARMTLDAYYAYALGGLLRKIGTRIRPYETLPGATDAFIASALEKCATTLEKRQPMVPVIKDIAAGLSFIPRKEGKRPKVALFGDFYVRDNDIFNQDLIRSIERAGGEVVTTSYVEYLKATVDAFFDRLLIERRYGPWLGYRAVMMAIASVEKSLERQTGLALSEGPWTNRRRQDAYRYFGIRPEMSGENYDNALKLLKILDEHPDLALFVQAAPAFCCASLVTEGMSKAIENLTGVPVLSITYDGTGAQKNDVVEPYLAKYGT